jgi:hypothetical protein
MRSPLRLTAFAIGVASAAWLSVGVGAQTAGAPERYTATATNTNNGTMNNIDITVDRWSTDQERDALVTTLVEKGSDKLLDVLQDLKPVGHFGTPGNLSWDLRFARRSPLPDGGERVVLATDRPIGFWEASRQPRSITYPFTVIELRLDAEGRGEGKISLATKVIQDRDRNTITLENYDLQPVLLTNVRRETSQVRN